MSEINKADEKDELDAFMTALENAGILTGWSEFMRPEANWVFDRPGHWKCSNCGYIEGRIAESKKIKAYCPKCGAKMKGLKYEIGDNVQRLPSES